MNIYVMVRDHAWSISPSDFRSALLNRWPDASVVDVTTGNTYSLKCELPDPDVYEARFMKDGEALVMLGQVEGCARVAVWFRNLVPRQHTVTFFDEAYNAAVDISPEMTPEAVTEAYTKELES